MPLLRQVGITPHELDELVDDQRWHEWCLAEPDLAQFSSLMAVRELRGKTEDQALGALLRLAATDGHDDQLAAVAVLHQLGGSVRTIARHFWHLSDRDIEGIVVGVIWEQIRTYDWRNRTRHHVAAIHHTTRKVVRSTLMPDASRTLGQRVVLLDPQSWWLEAIGEHAEGSTTSLDAFDSRDQLTIFLNWAASHGVVDDEEVGLLDALMDLDRHNTQIPQWLRGACSMAAIEHLASERGLCTKSVFRARNKVLVKLRHAAPQFLDEVA
jgi:hypothetical protein